MFLFSFLVFLGSGSLTASASHVEMLLISNGRMPWISWLGDVSSSPIMSQQKKHFELWIFVGLAAAFVSLAARLSGTRIAPQHFCGIRSATFANFFIVVIQIFLALLIFCHKRNNVMKMANCGVQGIELAPVSEVLGLGEQVSLSEKRQRFP